MLAALPQVVQTLMAGLSEEFGFTAVPGQMAEFMTADEMLAWNDEEWRLTPIICREGFMLAADELSNCVDDPTYLCQALTLGSLYVRLTALGSEVETLLELEMTPVGMIDAGGSEMQQGGMRFRITQHLGSSNRAAGAVFIQKGQEFAAWLNHRFNHSPRGCRIAGLQEKIKFAIAQHLMTHRWENLSAAAWRVHRQGLRWTPLR